jgi:hypothetical protein
VILTLEGEDAVWTEEDTTVFSGRYSDGSPFFAPDGKQIFFSSNRPLSGEGEPKSDHDLWFVKQTAGRWSEPQHLSTVINSNLNEDYPSVASNGNLYFYSDREDSIGRFDIYVGKFLFFVSNRRSIPASFERRLNYEEFYATLSQPGNGFGDIYWVDAGILEELSLCARS